MTETDLLRALALALNATEARRIATTLVTEHGFGWRPVGDHENEGAVNIANDTARTSIERITNAHAAVLEREAEKRLREGIPAAALPDSPRSAAQLWFGIVKGHLADSPPEHVRSTPLRERVWVAYSEGKNKSHPNFWCRDTGVGIRPEKFSSTILSIHGGNKVQKPYTIGLYGHGAATTFKGSPDGTLIVSRRAPELLSDDQPDVVGITLVVYDPRVPPDKTGIYKYLVRPDGQVAHIPDHVACAWDVPLVTREMTKVEKTTKKSTRWTPNDTQVHPFEPGTLVVHFNYDMGQFTKHLWIQGNSPLRLIDGTLFDPILPTGVLETRYPVDEEKTIKTSIRARLSYGARTKALWDHDDIVEGDPHEATATFKADINGEIRQESVIVEFWVLKTTAKDAGNKNRDLSWLPSHWNVILTAGGGGQTIHVESERFYNDPEHRLCYAPLGQGLLVHVNLDSLSAVAYRSVVNSNRAALSDGPTKNALIEAVRSVLRDDPTLRRVAAERHKAAISRTLMDDGLQKAFGKRMQMLNALSHAPNNERNGTPRGADLTPILPSPGGPDTLKIENDSPMLLRPGSKVTLNLACDIQDGIPDDLTVMTYPTQVHTDDPLNIPAFRHGRTSVTLRIRDDATPNTEGKLLVLLFASHKKLKTEIPWKIIAKPKPSDDPKNDGGDSHTRFHPSPPRIFPIRKEQWADQTEPWSETTTGRFVSNSSGGQLDLLVNVDHARLIRALTKTRYGSDHIEALKLSFAGDIGTMLHGLYTRSVTDPSTLDPILEAAIDVWITSHVRVNKTESQETEATQDASDLTLALAQTGDVPEA